MPKTLPETALADDHFDSYGVRIRNGLYEVKVTKGAKSGTGTAEVEADAYAAAKADLTPDSKAGK